MLSIINALKDAALKVNSAVQQTASGGWEGSAAESAAAAMASLRDFDDELHTHGGKDRDSAMGQSGESAATRNRVPPIPQHLDAQPTILGTTVDAKFRVDARRAAEDQARLVMEEYQETTRLRLAGLPQIAPVPTVVLDTSTDEPTAPGATQGQVTPLAPAPTSRSSSEPTIAQPSTHVTTTGEAPEPPGQGPDAGTISTAPQAAPQAVQASAGASVAARGDPGAAGGAAPVAAVGGIAAVPAGGPEVIGRPEVVGTKSGPDEGPKSGVERVVERQDVVRREGGGRAGARGTGGVLGGAASTPGDKDEEHHNRYHVPSGEPFESDDEYLQDGEFYVVPDVIGGSE
jgi:hypothetical protein